jgi:glycosyltransferase involved in cell wall biosynthesis
MKVLMLGWEFPPFISGGLGTACYGLTRAMSDIGVQVLFVLPHSVQSDAPTHVALVTPPSAPGGKASILPPSSQRRVIAGGPGTPGTTDVSVSEMRNVRFRAVDADINVQPYDRPGQSSYVEQDIEKLIAEYKTARPGTPGWEEFAAAADEPPPVVTSGKDGHYGGDMFEQIDRYARFVAWLSRRESFDVIHAHDWMTYRAGIAASRIAGKPLVVHVHSTEFDRSGEHVNQRIYDIERAGVHAASKVIAVSFLTKNILTARYGVSGDKVGVVYNAIDRNGDDPAPPSIRRDEKIVLFLGRITMQKGPEYFLEAARLVLQKVDNVRFVMAGSGDLIRKSIEMAAEMGIGHKVLFTGFLRGADVARVFKMADLYVMPSVSEPFGIAPLEALSHDVPVIISKQSGVAEVLTHVLKVDFWDTREMANKIVAVLKHPPLHAALKEHGSFEVRKLAWRDSARRCLAVYRTAMGQAIRI